MQRMLSAEDAVLLNNNMPIPVHAQGEHIFNAVDALAQDIAGRLRPKIRAGDAADAANNAVDALEQAATALGLQRNNAEFRTAAVGDPINASRYSTLVTTTRQVIDNLTNGASGVTVAYTTLNKYLADIEHYTIDQKAKTTKRAALGGHRRGPFDTWFNQTSQDLYDTYRSLRDAALAVARTHAS